MSLTIKNTKLLQVLGILGIISYAVGPIIIPGADFRAPELLPVYTLMIGLGQLFKGGVTIKADGGASEENPSTKQRAT